MTPLIGDLVISSEFRGIGKVYSVDEITSVAEVTFFESPEEPDARRCSVSFDSVEKTELADEMIIYCIHPLHNKWQRARYGGQRPDGHLVIFRRGETDVMRTSDIYVINIGGKPHLDPRAFLSQRCCDTPFYMNYRSGFLTSYIEQRNACRSISSVLSSAVELEPYQLAVVRRVLQDDVKKYLLADEVGLGKTIEAGMIVHELMVNDLSSMAVIAVPEALVQQWRDELGQRFFLEPLFDINLIICSHEDLVRKLSELDSPPRIIVIDEAHQIAGRGWSKNPKTRKSYTQISDMCDQSEVCLLLSGTPMNGNETNFLSMLHLLNRESYPLTEEGIANFKIKIAEREKLGGIYQALTPSNDNTTLSELLEEIVSVIPSDSALNDLVGIATPLVDWISGEEEGGDRSRAVNSIRKHLGENYRLHQRMLRNRRDDPYIAGLFPGLSGLELLPWSIEETNLSLEETLDDFRGEYLTADNVCQAITVENFRVWVELALSNPVLVAERAIECLRAGEGGLGVFEIDALNGLIEISKQEQEEKDFIFLSYVNQWLLENPSGKIVVFGGNELTADHITSFLEEKIPTNVERHEPGEIIEFLLDDEIRVLVCDQRGEDGLNLHGGKKLVIHYDLPVSISRLEQRLGRVNRYSAHKYASPILSVVLTPNRKSYGHYWLKVLNDEINIFSQSVACLQYVLEPYIENTWADLSKVGNGGLKSLRDQFHGEKGTISRERLKIHAQEQLNTLEAEIFAAQEYSETISKSDEKAEEQVNRMQDWITKGLLFRKKKGEISSTFRYEYQASTLMDHKTFVAKCLLGVDFENSSRESPVTHLMSFDRAVCSDGNNVHPFRFGQPFVNTMYDTLASDSRGISSAQIRFLNGKRLKEPKACFKIEWLISHIGSNKIAADEIYPPHIILQWLKPSGDVLDNVNIINILEKPYSKTDEFGYKDVNLRTERWENVEEYFPEEDWRELVNHIHLKGYEQANSSLVGDAKEVLSIECLSFSVIILA